MHLRICSLFLVTICFLTPLRSELPNEYNSWTLVRSENFTVMTNDRPPHAEKIAHKLEILRYMFSQLHADKRVGAPVPTYVYAFKSDGNFGPYKSLVDGKSANASGYFLWSFDANFIALARGSSREPIFHEFIHYFMNTNLSETPLWYAEGMAEYYSTLEVDDNVARLGRVHDRHVEELRATELMPLEELFATGKDSPYYNESGKQGKFYAQSWALVHYMQLRDPSLIPKLADYLMRLAGGEQSDAAFRNAFGTDPDTLLEALRQYVQADDFKVMSLKFESLKIDFKTTHEALDRADYLYHLGNLLAHHEPERNTEAEEHLAAVLEIDPRRAAALRSLGYVRYRQGRRDDAVEYFKKASALPPKDDPLIRLYHGRVELERYLERVSTGDQPSEADLQVLQSATRMLAKAASAEPPLGPALRLHAEALVLAGDCKAGIPAVKKAWKIYPTQIDFAHDLVVLLAQCDQLDRAKQMAQIYLGSDVPEPMQRSAWSAVVEAELAVIEELLGRKKRDKALDKLRALHDAVENPFVQNRVSEYLAQTVAKLPNEVR